MIEEIAEKVREDIDMFLKSESEYKDSKIDYILLDDNKNSIVVISDENEITVIYVSSDKNETPKYESMGVNDFAYEVYLFDNLKNNYQIGYMNYYTHCDIWCTIYDLYPEDLERTDGLKEYISYCKRNNITKKVLDKELNIDVPDIMDLDI